MPAFRVVGWDQQRFHSRSFICARNHKWGGCIWKRVSNPHVLEPIQDPILIVNQNRVVHTGRVFRKQVYRTFLARARFIAQTCASYFHLTVISGPAPWASVAAILGPNLPLST
jgi:hypothetical protein